MCLGYMRPVQYHACIMTSFDGGGGGMRETFYVCSRHKRAPTLKRDRY